MSNGLSAWTTIGIGGNARSVTVVRSRGELEDTAPRGLVIGGGSDILVSDDGYDGDVIINRTSGIVRQCNTVIADSGVRLPVLCKYLAECGLSGLEWACGIPGTVGGATVMNAGAFGGSISDRLVYADVLRNGRTVRMTNAELGFGYRCSGLLSDDTVLCAAFELFPDIPRNIVRRCADHNALRRRKQPIGKTAGSVFKNPPGVSVGRVLDEAGLKGARAGGAVISDVHANVIVNTGGATAKDVCTLIAKMKSALAERNIPAHEEIIYIGDF